jgi:hypothetical protein
MEGVLGWCVEASARCSLARDSVLLAASERGPDRRKDCMVRSLMLCLCLLMTVACDPVRNAGIAVSARPGIAVDSSQSAGFARDAFALAERVARRRGLELANPNNQWNMCAAKRDLWPLFQFCGRVNDGEPQFLLSQMGKLRFTPSTDSLRRELLDSLRDRFPRDSVRECEWVAERGCRPLLTRERRSPNG